MGNERGQKAQTITFSIMFWFLCGFIRINSSTIVESVTLSQPLKARLPVSKRDKRIKIIMKYKMRITRIPKNRKFKKIRENVASRGKMSVGDNAQR